jgi:predicted phosphoribosyltransferase
MNLGRRLGFADREDAGRQLADALHTFADIHPVVVGLPRGGVVVADQVARRLGAVLDVVVVRKLGAPSQPELALGALGEGGVCVLDESLLRECRIDAGQLEALERREATELARRVRLLRAGRPAVPVVGRTVLLVDDGVATGSVARAAGTVLRARGARRVVVAVPVGPVGVRERLCPPADDVVCLETPEYFYAVGQYYRNFSQTTDEEVVQLLQRSYRGLPSES